MIVYFSGTGNSRFAAQLLAAETGDNLTDAFAFLRNGKALNLHSDRPWIFVSPTYAWRIPRVFQQQIEQGSFSGSRAAYFVMTCGSEIGNAGQKLVALCRAKGFDYLGVLPLVMPENYLAMFDVPDAAAANEIVDKAEKQLRGQIPRILEEQPFAAPNISLLDRCYTSAINPLFQTFALRTRPFHTTDVCTHCGKCVQLCPLHNITLEHGTPRWGKRCTHCMACICGCPTEAIEFGKISVGKPRWHCREYTKESPAPGSLTGACRKE